MCAGAIVARIAGPQRVKQDLLNYEIVIRESTGSFLGDLG